MLVGWIGKLSEQNWLQVIHLLGTVLRVLHYKLWVKVGEQNIPCSDSYCRWSHPPSVVQTRKVDTLIHSHVHLTSNISYDLLIDSHWFKSCTRLNQINSLFISVPSYDTFKCSYNVDLYINILVKAALFPKYLFDVNEGDFTMNCARQIKSTINWTQLTLHYLRQAFHLYQLLLPLTGRNKAHDMIVWMKGDVHLHFLLAQPVS